MRNKVSIFPLSFQLLIFESKVIKANLHLMPLPYDFNHLSMMENGIMFNFIINYDKSIFF